MKALAVLLTSGQLREPKAVCTKMCFGLYQGQWALALA